MDKYLRPDKFDADPNSADATKLWTYWCRTFNNFLNTIEAQDGKKLKEDDKLKLLTNLISHAVYEYVSEIKEYSKAIETLNGIFIKQSNEVFARHLLATRRQQVGETVDQYVQQLKLLSKDCNFKKVTMEQNKNDCIRDAFINGLLSSEIRQRLLENNTLNLDDAISQSRSLEDARKHSEAFSSSHSILNATSSKKNTTQIHSEIMTVPTVAQKCYFCGGTKHPRAVCPARDEICNYCKKLGHFAKVCMRSKNSKSKSTLSSMSLLASTTPMFPYCLHKSLIEAKINNENANCLVDTGSSDSFLNYEFARDNNFKMFPSSGQVSMASVTLSSNLKGYCVINFEFLGNRYENFKISVLPNLCTDAIIGHDLMKQHSRVEVHFGGSKPALSICCLTEANVNSPQLFGNLSPDCKPIATKSRRHSEKDEQFIRLEVKKLLEENIIEESVSPWRAQVLVTKNEHHKRRMVIDYSQTINKFTLLDAYPLPNIENLVSKVAKYGIFSTIDLKSAYHQIPIRDNEKVYTAFEAGGQLYQFRRIPFGVTNGVSCFQRTLDSIIKREELKGVYTYLDDITVCGENQEIHDQNLQKFLAVVNKYNFTLNENKCKYSKKSINLLGYTIENTKLKPDPERLKPLIDLQPPNNNASLRRVLGMFAHYSKWIPRFSEKIRGLVSSKSFPLQSDVIADFEKLKIDVANSVLHTIIDNEPLVVETDASDFAIAATLSQADRPIAFYSKTLSDSERRYSAIEKEAQAIVEALRKWRHYLIGRHFKLITDQQSVSFMFDVKHTKQIKNDKIMRWRLELSCYSYDIIYRPGIDNVVADTFSRICGASNDRKLFELHESLCHPGVTRMYHFVRTRNLPYSLEDVKHMSSACPICAEIKPQFLKNSGKNLIKATSPFERLNIDFKGPIPSVSHNRYILTIVDEYSRFPFAFPCPNTDSSTVISCLNQLFSIFGMPSYLHSDRGSSFISRELVTFLNSKDIASSRTTPYNPQGNGLVERYNGIIWKSVNLALRSRNLKISQWETVLPDALHSIRSLLCTSINCSPHERMFYHPRRSTNGTSIPSWLSPSEKVFLKKHVRQSKYDSLVEEVEVIEVNPKYALIRHENGRESTVSLKHLAPRGNVDLLVEEDLNHHPAPEEDINLLTQPEPRRSTRFRQPPQYFDASEQN